MTFSVRLLGAADATIYRDLRLEALRAAPTAFSSDYASEERLPDEEWPARLARTQTYGAFSGEVLIGIATFVAETRPKIAHRGNVFAVYVKPAARGKGAGRALFEKLIEGARGRVLQLHLSVTEGNEPARRLYEGLGFTLCGTEPRYIQVDGRFYDEHLMVLRLDRGQPESDE